MKAAARSMAEKVAQPWDKDDSLTRLARRDEEELDDEAVLPSVRLGPMEEKEWPGVEKRQASEGLKHAKQLLGTYNQWRDSDGLIHPRRILADDTTQNEQGEHLPT